MWRSPRLESCCAELSLSYDLDINWCLSNSQWGNKGVFLCPSTNIGLSMNPLPSEKKAHMYMHSDTRAVTGNRNVDRLMTKFSVLGNCCFSVNYRSQRRLDLKQREGLISFCRESLECVLTLPWFSVRGKLHARRLPLCNHWSRWCAVPLPARPPPLFISPGMIWL